MWPVGRFLLLLLVACILLAALWGLGSWAFGTSLF